jgi:hypothetical protein
MFRLVVVALSLTALAADSDQQPVALTDVVETTPTPVTTQLTETIRVVLTSGGLFVEQGTKRFGPYPVQPHEVATSKSGEHFALAYQTRLKHHIMVIDGRMTEFMGPDRIHALWFESDRLLVYHRHWNTERSFEYIWLASPSPLSP